MSDVTDPLDQPDLAMYCSDLLREVQRMDALVVVAHGHAPASILNCPEYPEGGIPGERAGCLASFLTYASGEPTTQGNVVHLRMAGECYALWQRGVARKLKSPQFLGFGDADIKQYWFLTACSLVRSRVLFHPSWFPRATCRDVSSIRKKHARSFGDAAFMELRALPDMFDDRLRSAIEIDMQLTQFLIAASVQNGLVADDSAIVEMLISD